MLRTSYALILFGCCLCFGSLSADQANTAYQAPVQTYTQYEAQPANNTNASSTYVVPLCSCGCGCEAPCNCGCTTGKACTCYKR